IDAFVGALAEDHVAGADVGALTKAVLVNQFTRLRDGDRLFYLNQQWNPEELKILQQGNTLAKVIEHNAGITNLQSNVFFFKASISGAVSSGVIGTGHDRHNNVARGVAGVPVQLRDDEGNVLATTVTDSQGRYHF